ncbi:hypothetical protein ACFL2Y_04715 [Candidatus Omnitrophota bacterium]
MTNVASGATGSYPWQIPGGGVDDDHAVLEDRIGDLGFEEGQPLNAMVRVEDAEPDGGKGDSGGFTIDYYNIEWEMRDLLTNQPLSELNGVSTSGWDFSNRTSGVVTRCPYGQWDFTWSKTGYADVMINFDSFNDLTGEDKISFFMETNVVHIWRSETRFAYVPDTGTGTDALNVTSWLERDGGLITGGIFWDVAIYDDDGTKLITLTHNSEPWKIDPVADPYTSPQGPDPDTGVYSKTWANTGLEAGKVYTVITRIQIGTGGTFRTPSTLEVTLQKDLKEVKDTIDTKLDIPMSEVRADVQTALDTQLGVIQGEMEDQTKIIQDKMDQFTGAAEDLESAAAISLISAAELEEAAAISQEAAVDLQGIARRNSAKLLIPQAVVTGEPAKIRYRGYKTGLRPLIDILDFENNPIIISQPMSEIPGKPGLYEYEIKNIDSKTYEPGAPFTVIVSDDFTGNVESGAVFVETAIGKLLLPNTVLSGDKVILRFRGKGGWKPTITIVDYEGTDIVTDVKMTPIIGKERLGYFQYTIPKITSDLYVSGKPVTVTVYEPTTATVESGTFMVESTSLTSLEGLLAAGLGKENDSQQVLESINAIRGTLATGGDVGLALENIKYKLGRLPKEIGIEGIAAPIVDKVDEIKNQFVQFAGEEGYDFSQLLEIGLEKSTTVTDIRTTTDRIRGASDVMGEIIERELGGSDRPIVQVIFE